MMNAIFVLFGEGHDLDALQMGMRSIVVFVIAVVLIRVSGRRSFGQRSTFDSVVVILLGDAGVVVGDRRVSSPAGVGLPSFERLVGGSEREVFRNGVFDAREMRAALITPTDVQESVRQKTGSRSMDDVAAAILERNGEISVIRKRPQAN